MKKAKSTSDDLRPEYKRSDFKRLERGKYREGVKASSDVAALDPEVAPHLAQRNPRVRERRILC